MLKEKSKKRTRARLLPERNVVGSLSGRGRPSYDHQLPAAKVYSALKEEVRTGRAQIGTGGITLSWVGEKTSTERNPDYPTIHFWASNSPEERYPFCHAFQTSQPGADDISEETGEVKESNAYRFKILFCEGFLERRNPTLPDNPFYSFGDRELPEELHPRI